MTQDFTLAKLAILTWRYLYLLKMRICDFFKALLTWVMTKNVDTSVTTTNFILTCSSRELLQLSGNRLSIQHRHTATNHFDTWSVHLAADLLHYSTCEGCPVLPTGVQTVRRIPWTSRDPTLVCAISIAFLNVRSVSASNCRWMHPHTKRLIRIISLSESQYLHSVDSFFNSGTYIAIDSPSWYLWMMMDGRGW